MVTCYDYTFARLLSKSPIDGILVGDSAAMVMQGHPSTLSASTELMRLHTEAVVRGAAGKFIVADMPFLSFRRGLAAALDSTSILMVAGAHAVKLEGVDGHEDVIQTNGSERYTCDGPYRAAASIHACLWRLSSTGPKQRLGPKYRPAGGRSRGTWGVCDRARERASEPCPGN